VPQSKTERKVTTRKNRAIYSTPGSPSRRLVTLYNPGFPVGTVGTGASGQRWTVTERLECAVCDGAGGPLSLAPGRTVAAGREDTEQAACKECGWLVRQPDARADGGEAGGVGLVMDVEAASLWSCLAVEALLRGWIDGWQVLKGNLLGQKESSRHRTILLKMHVVTALDA
jgi:hypothetical protein